MKATYLFVALGLTACNNSAKRSDSVEHSNSTGALSSLVKKKTVPSKNTPINKLYSNERFKQVTVAKVGEHSYSVRGKAQIFEATFGWDVEDRHNILKEGNQMADAGAPEWGNFDFTFDVEKLRPNSALTLILFESSAKDGSRQHELAIPLNQ